MDATCGVRGIARRLAGRLPVMGDSSEEVWISRLIEVGRGLVTDLDLGVVLDRVLETARELTGARYAALGVLNDERTELAQFLTSGVDGGAREEIGDLPRGRGHPRCADRASAAAAAEADLHATRTATACRPGTRRSGSFLGVPMMIRGQAWGNLYLGEKEGGESSPSATSRRR